jgi:hypothetical protein
LFLITVAKSEERKSACDGFVTKKCMTAMDPEASERDKVYADLVDYCTRDTWAMVAIHRALIGM